MKLFFHKMIKFNENGPKSTSHFSSCRKKFKKWDQTLATIFGLLAVLTLIVIGIYNNFNHKSCTDCKPNQEASCDNKDEENRIMVPASKFVIRCRTIRGSCHMICTYIQIKESLEDHINAAHLLFEPPCSQISLDIKLTQFAEGQLSNGWLKNIKPNVTRLTIYENNLREINAQAFQGHPFKENLNYLRIGFTNITTLRKNSFLGLSSLKSFQFSSVHKMKLEIEEEALTGMDNLTTLQMGMFILTSKDVINLIGDKGVPLPQLQYLSLMHNFFPELLENSFTNIKESVTEVNLGYSGIETIHKKAFSGMKNIEILKLESNNFETLEDGTFNSLSNLIPGGLRLGYNKWNCTCSLQWLKDYFVNTNVIDKSNPPLCNDEIEFEDFEFCPTSPATTSSTASSQTEGTSTSTISINPDCSKIREKSGIKILQCKNEISYPKYDESHRVEIIVENHQVTLHLQELVGAPLKVKVVLAEPTEIVKDYYLVWATLKNKTKYGCDTPLEDGMILQLERGTTYTFSVLYQCESETSPKSIFAVKTLPEWSFRTWISNKYQAEVMGITVLVVICMMGVAILATFLCIRRYPKPIGGNKNVIIVKSKETEESAPSRELEEPQYWEPSNIPSTEGYLTPKCHTYDRDKNRSPLTRSFSEHTVSSITSIYGQTSQWKDPHVRRQNQTLEWSEIVERVEVHAHQNYRPPVPPPNPGTSCGSSK